MLKKSRLEIPYSIDTRLSSRLISSAFAVSLAIGICLIKNISIVDIPEFLITISFSLLVGALVLISQNGQKIEITAEGISIEPDRLIFYKVGGFYKVDELEKIKLCPVDNVEYQRGYIEIITKTGNNFMLDTLFPSQVAYFGEMISKTFQIPLDASDFIKLDWHEGLSEDVLSKN
ncbi:MAG: hypothetical protein WC043_02405 [Pseudobdellovibrionaceae bacterium]